MKHLIILFSLIYNSFAEVRCFRAQIDEAFEELNLLEDPTLIKFGENAKEELRAAYDQLNPDEKNIVDHVMQNRKLTYESSSEGGMVQNLAKGQVKKPEDIVLSISWFHNDSPAFVTILRHEFEHIVDDIKATKKLLYAKDMEVKAFSAQYDLYRRSFDVSDVEKFKQTMATEAALNQAEEAALSKYFVNGTLNIGNPDLIKAITDGDEVLKKALQKKLKETTYGWFLSDFEDAMTLDKATYLKKRLALYKKQIYLFDSLRFIVNNSKVINVASGVLAAIYLFLSHLGLL